MANLAFMPLCFNSVSSQRIKHLEEKAGMAKNKAEAEAGMAKNKNKTMENEKAASRRRRGFHFSMRRI